MLRSREFLGWLSEATGIPKLLYDPVYTGGGTHLNLNGQELDHTSISTIIRRPGFIAG
jgi:hypothetical protein